MCSGSRESSRSGGISCTEGSARFTSGVPLLLDGIDTVVLIVALFVLGEAIYVAAKIRPGKLLTRRSWMFPPSTGRCRFCG